MEAPLTGEPDAGDPPVRFGGRGDRLSRASLPLSNTATVRGENVYPRLQFRAFLIATWHYTRSNILSASLTVVSSCRIFSCRGGSLDHGGHGGRRKDKTLCFLSTEPFHWLPEEPLVGGLHFDPRRVHPHDIVAGEYQYAPSCPRKHVCRHRQGAHLARARLRSGQVGAHLN